MELTLAQRSRRGRESAEPSDVLLLLLRRDTVQPGGGGGGGGGGGVRLVCCSNRSLGSVVGCEALLEPGHYLVLPLSLRPSSVTGPLRVVLRVAACVEKGQG